jgi:hypothetical protein
MFGSQILDVAVGLIFVYLLVSLIVSIVNEWIARLFALRASTLEDGLRNLLQDPRPATKETASLVDLLYNHPLIQGASPLRSRGKSWLHLHVPFGTPTSGLADQQVGKIAPDVKVPAWATDPATRTGRPSYIDPRQFSLALLDLVAPNGTQSHSFQDLKSEVSQIQNARLQRSLLTLISTAHNDIELARANIENWFNDGMDRVGGWYKRKIQIIGLIVGLLLAILLNADTLAVVRTLWTQPAVRDAIARSAEQYVQQRAGQASPDANFDAERQKLEQSLGELSATNLPIGWILEPAPQTTTGQTPPPAPDPRRLSEAFGSLTAFLSKVIGLLLTGAAVSLGAPFWFDALEHITSLRSTGDPPSTDSLAGTPVDNAAGRA